MTGKRLLSITFVGSAVLLAQYAVARAAPDDAVDAVEAAPVVANAVVAQNFDQVILPGFVSVAAAHAQITTRMTLFLAMANRVCTISDEEQTKMKLAARGDVKRLMQQTEELRKRLNAAQNDAKEQAAVGAEVPALQNRTGYGLCGEHSLVGKTLRNMLDAERLAKFDAEMAARTRRQYRATIEALLVVWEESVPVSGDQHDALVKILSEETPPPLIFGRFDDHYVRYRLATLPARTINALLDDHQRELLGGVLGNAQRIKPFLVQNGVIAAEVTDITD
jgi:hypothetical protein